MAVVQPGGFSVQGEYFAHSSPDGTLRIYDTATGALKQEYTPSSHLSTTCSCLSWSTVRRSSGTPKQKRKKKKSLDGSVSGGSELIALGTTSGTIILYSIVKGDIQTLLEGGHADIVHGAAWCSSGETLFTCSSDQHIVQWDLSTGNYKEKWKADRGSVYSLCLCQNERYLLSAGRSIKMWDLENRTTVKMFTGHASEVFNLKVVPTVSVEESGDSIPNFYFISAACNDRLLHVWHTVSKGKTAVASFTLPDEPVNLSINQPASDQSIELAAVTKSGEMLLYEHGLNGPMKKPIKPSKTVQIAADSSSQTPKPIPIFAAHLCGDMSFDLLLAHGNFLKLTFERLKVAEMESHTCLVRKDPTKSSVQKETSVTKVKTPTVDQDVTVLAPGRMAVPAGPSRQDSSEKPSKKKRRKSAAGDASLDERLNAISIDKPAAPSGSEPPKADTLATLLSQGLQSNDKKILNNVLQHTGEAVIRNTVRRLPLPVIVPLVKELSTRMHGHSQSGHTLVRWMKAVLAVHTSYLMTFPELVATLGSVYQMMESRTALFGRLSRLQGKLDLMLSQISTQTEEEDPVSSQIPMLVYQDDSSDDELMTGDLVPESEDDWNEDMSEDGEGAKENGEDPSSDEIKMAINDNDESDDDSDSENGNDGSDEDDSDSEKGNDDNDEEESMESDAGE